MDPGAVHQLEMMKATLEECMAQLDEQIEANGELQKELDTAQITMLENREQRVLDWEKFKVQENNRMALETAKLEQNGVELNANIQLESEKLMMEAENNQRKAQNETDMVMLEAQKTAEAQQKVYSEGEDAGYEQGVSDGVDAAYGR